MGIFINVVDLDDTMGRRRQRLPAQIRVFPNYGLVVYFVIIFVTLTIIFLVHVNENISNIPGIRLIFNIGAWIVIISSLGFFVINYLDNRRVIPVSVEISETHLAYRQYIFGKIVKDHDDIQNVVFIYDMDRLVRIIITYCDAVLQFKPSFIRFSKQDIKILGRLIDQMINSDLITIVKE